MAEFDINAALRDGDGAIKATARMPSLGPENVGAFGNAAEYVAAVHAVINDRPSSPTDPMAGSNVIAAKALGVDVPQAYSYASLSFMPDTTNYGLMQWPGINPESLCKICRDNIAPQLVIRSRVADLARYAGLSTHPWKPGWRITMRDALKTPSEQDRKDIKAAESFILNCGRDYGYQDARTRDSHLLSPFGQFLRTFANDIHTYDGWGIWTQTDRARRVTAFANLPAGMIRLAAPGRGIQGDLSKFAALVDETGNPVKKFTRYDLVWKVMNPRNDPSAYGYGWPIPEMAMRLIQGFQSAIDLNCDTFVKNGMPNGMLLLKGDFFNQEQIDAMMREWTNMKRGVSKMWGVPVMSIPEGGDVEILDFMNMKGQELRYKDHLNMMAGLACVLWQFPVRRLGMFTSGNHRDNQPTPDESVESQGVDDPGLPPLLGFIEDAINPYLLWSNWPHLQFGFMAKDPKNDAREYEARKQAQTWKEARAAADLPSLVSIVPENMKAIAEIMEMCPEDSSKTGVFQTLANTMLEAKLGISSDGKDKETSGAPFPSKTDPAKSQEHGHRAGVRRSSAKEEARASS